MKKAKKKRVVIKTPYPTAKKVAKELGVSMKRLKELEKMVDEIMKISAQKRKNKKSKKKKPPK